MEESTDANKEENTKKGIETTGIFTYKNSIMFRYVCYEKNLKEDEAINVSAVYKESFSDLQKNDSENLNVFYLNT